MAKRFWQDLWTLLNTDVQELGLVSFESADKTIEGTKSLIELAGTLSENQKDLTQLASALEVAKPLIDALDSPMASVVGGVLPFGSIGLGILKVCLQQMKQDPSLGDCVMVVGQAAYLESFKEIVSSLEDAELKRSIDPLLLKQLMKLQSEQLKPLELDDRAAKEAIDCFHDSALAKALGQGLRRAIEEQALQAQPPALTETMAKAKRLIDRVARHTHSYLYQALAQAGDGAKPLAELFRNGGDKKLEQTESIRRYLREKIASQPQEQVFKEETDGKKLSFAEIYVPMQAKRLDSQGRFVDEAAFDLETWATDILNDDAQNQSQVMFIQGEPGHGKSVFCRIYADRVRRHLYPIWIPIVIRLRDVEILPQFREILRQAVTDDFAASDEGWLTDTNTRFLFLLDGFDELVLTQQKGEGLKDFLENVSKFQRDCADRPQEQGHRVLITGRPMALQGYEFSLPNNLSRVGIVPMADDLQERWMANWQAYTGEANTQKLRSLIRAEQCPEELQNLAREPLLLYLLAVLARSDKLNPQVFDQKQGIAVKIEIYSTLIDFVLEQQRTDAATGKNRTETLTGLKPKQLRGVLGELALCITQTGTEATSVAALKQRMSEKAEREIDDLAKNHVLTAFYFKSESKSGSIEFIHKSFREFLTAERLQRDLKNWTETRQDTYDGEKDVVADKELYEQIYDLLGYGILTTEILDYLIGLLQQRTQFDWGKLAQRLQRFYFRWAKGEFIEQTTETLPQKKARQLQAQQIQRGQRQVDLYTGLNAMILLFELHRYGQTLEETVKDLLSFHPCGSGTTGNWDATQLLKLIGYSDCLGVSSSNNLLGRHFSSADLSSADLRRADLRRANLRSANLRSANLSSADLRSANLSSADLRSANLSSANLRSADLRSADLRSTDLRSADLRSAYLSRADLRSAYLSSANLSSANLRSAYLSSANLRSADLRSADLRSANLSSANLSRADLSRANLRRANLRRADLRRANLRSAYLDQANLDEVRWDAETHWDNAYNLHTVLNVPENLSHHSPFVAAVRLSKGVALAQQGESDAAIQAYDAAQQRNPNLSIDAPHWQHLCWYGCLHNHAEQVLCAGEKAVELLGDEAETSCLEARGMARAITQDLAGALEDLQAAQKSDRCFYTVISQQSRSNEEAKAQRDRWIASLQQGENPFTLEELAALRQVTP